MSTKTTNGFSRGSMNPDNARTAGYMRITSEEFDKKALASYNKAKKTREETSPEKKEKQKGYHLTRQQIEDRIAETEQELESHKAELYNNLSASAKEIGVEKAIKKYASDLKAFKALSDENYSLYSKLTNVKKNSYYQTLIADLIKVDAKFGLFANNEFFTTLNEGTFLTKLTLDERTSIITKLEEAGITENPNFIKYYAKYFKNYINRLTDIDDISFSIGLYPENLNLAPDSFKTLLTQNTRVLYGLVLRNYDIVNYLNLKELTILADNYNKVFGKAVYLNPDVLDKLPADFFTRYSPKFLFSGLPKVKFIEALGDRILNFPELVTFFKYTKTDNNNLSI